MPVTIAEAVGSKGFATARHGDALLTGAGRDEKAGDKSLLCIRPQHLSLTADIDHTNRIVGTLREVHWQGELTHLVLDVDGTPVRVSATRLPIALPEPGTKVPLFFAPADTSLLSEDSGV